MRFSMKSGGNGGAKWWRGTTFPRFATDRLGCALAWKQSDALRVSPCGVVSVKISATRWNTGGATCQNTLGEAQRRHRPAIRCEPIHTSVSSCYHEGETVPSSRTTCDQKGGVFYETLWTSRIADAEMRLLNWALSLSWP